MKTWTSRCVAILMRISRIERRVLLAMAMAAVGLFAFSQIAQHVTDGTTLSIDESILLAFRTPGDFSDPIGPRWFEEVMRDFTALGSFSVVILVTLAVIGFLLLAGHRRMAFIIFCSIATGILASHMLKWGFARPRPELVPHHVTVYTKSFPSGHAMLSAIVYLTLGILLAQTQKEIRIRVYLYAVAIFITVVVGISRIYLGVHWPTDVLGGWAAGISWALLSWVAGMSLQSTSMKPAGTDNRIPPVTR
jgi:undecaprenyl-diphosphatase